MILILCLEEQFTVEIFSRTNPYGWRLAAVSDIRDSSGYVKDAVKSAMSGWEWGIACLANDARVNISSLKTIFFIILLATWARIFL